MSKRALLEKYRSRELSRTALALPLLLAVGSAALSEQIKGKEVFSEQRAQHGSHQSRGPLFIDSSLVLRDKDMIDGGVVIEGAVSNIVLDCRGGTIRGPDPGQRQAPAIEIRSRRLRVDDGAVIWVPPSGIKIKNCRIQGRVQITGMPGNGEDLRQSSRREGHTARAQGAAPSDISIDRVSISTEDDIPVYIGSGATRVRITDSRIGGATRSVAIYLDAESGGHVISGNEISTKTGRETIAVDGSASNRIFNNKIFIDNFPGIALYRNCGEKGVIRHQTPSFNIIEQNEFVNISNYRPRHVVENSRGGRSPYCHEDDGYPLGSSVDNMDGGVNNIIR